MPCDRCGGELEEFELQGRVSTVCKECESLDVLVEHEPPERTTESWTEAIARFYDKTETTELTVEQSGETSKAPSDD